MSAWILDILVLIVFIKIIYKIIQSKFLVLLATLAQDDGSDG